eukprot:3141854-Pleurochrysis_carterae.AAC.3
MILVGNQPYTIQVTVLVRHRSGTVRVLACGGFTVPADRLTVAAKLVPTFRHACSMASRAGMLGGPVTHPPSPGGTARRSTAHWLASGPRITVGPVTGGDRG